MATKILIDQQDFALLNAVKIYMSLDGITHEQYINTMCEHAQSALSEYFQKSDSSFEFVIEVARVAKQRATSNGVLATSTGLVRRPAL